MAISTYAMSQDLQEVVYLKNGSVLHGTIVENYPGDKLTIETTQGDRVTCQMADVQKYTKEKTDNDATAKVGYPARGYRGFIEGAAMFGHLSIGNGSSLNCTGPAFFTTHGYQFNSHIFAGAGIGFARYGGEQIILRYDPILYVEVPNYDSADEECGTPSYATEDVNNLNLFPAYLAFRYDMLENRISPYADARLGIVAGDYRGMFLSVSAGVRIRHFNVGIGYMGTNGDYAGHDVDYSGSSNAFIVQCGFDLGRRN